MSELFSRRSFLKISGAVAVSAALAACSGGDGGSTGGGNGGGTSGDIDTTKWYDVGNGIQMQGSISAAYTQPKNSNYYPYLSINLKNNTNQPVTITKSQFSNIIVDADTAAAYALYWSRGEFKQTITIDANSQSQVQLYLTKPFDSLDKTKHTVSFDYSYDNTKKVRCSGSYYQDAVSTSIFTITQLL